MEFLAGLFIIIVLGIAADTVVKVVKARAGAGQVNALRTELDELSQQVADAHAALASQAEQIQELHERVDFAERMLAQMGEKPAIGGRQPERGSGEG